MLKVWTDGACFPNPGMGGWGWTDLQGQEGSGGSTQTTNQIMELTAVIEALRELGPRYPLIIVSDSQYVIRGSTDWIHSWLVNGWRNSKGGPVANRALWEELHDLNLAFRPKYQWVRGHSGDPGNERADELATRASGASRALIESCKRRYHGEEAR